MRSAGFYWISCLAVNIAIVCHLTGHAQENGQENRILYSSFASGQKFYLESDSFQPIGNGKLQYTVTSDTGNGAHRVSRNEIDCSTGQLKSPIESWHEDSKGGISDQKPGPVVKVQLTERTELYRTLKDACRENLPQQPMNW